MDLDRLQQIEKPAPTAGDGLSINSSLKLISTSSIWTALFIAIIACGCEKRDAEAQVAERTITRNAGSDYKNRILSLIDPFVVKKEEWSGRGGDVRHWFKLNLTDASFQSLAEDMDLISVTNPSINWPGAYRPPPENTGKWWPLTKMPDSGVFLRASSTDSIMVFACKHKTDYFLRISVN